MFNNILKKAKKTMQVSADDSNRKISKIPRDQDLSKNKRGSILPNGKGIIWPYA